MQSFWTTEGHLIFEGQLGEPKVKDQRLADYFLLLCCDAIK